MTDRHVTAPKASPTPSCLVCGSTMMARSHLFPRKLMHDIRREAKHLIGVRGIGRRVGFLQSGEVSQQILCHKHEGATQTYDDAAIRLIRRFERLRQSSFEGHAWSMPNPRPRELGLFVHAVIWRHWASWSLEGHGPSFPAELLSVVQKILFDGGELFPTVMLHAGRTHDGGPALYAMAPAEASLGDVQLVRFEIGGFAFFLFPEHKTLARPWADLRTSHNPLMILQLDHGEIRNDPNIMRFIKGAKAPPNL